MEHFIRHTTLYSLNYGVPRHFFVRLLARLTDYLLLVLLNMLAIGQPTFYDFLFSMVFYYGIFAFYQGETIGRRLWGLSYDTENKSFFRLVGREVLLFFFWPIIGLEVLFTIRPFLHDRWLDIIVQKTKR